jgi:hypothetical protein
MKAKTTRKPKAKSPKVPKPADLMHATMDHLNLVGGLLLHLRDFLRSARPEELQLLDDLVYEWEDRGGQFSKDSFFRVVAQKIANGECRAS